MVAVSERLSFARIEGVHGVTHLMNNRKDILQRIRVVQQNIRLAVVGAEAVSAAGFALIFVNINPAFLGAFLNLREVFCSERSKTFLHHRKCLFIRNISLRKLNKGHINIVHLEFIHAENLLAKLRIAVEHRKVFVHNGD